MKRCVYVTLPEGWGWLPIDDFPEDQRAALGDGQDIEEEEIYRSEPSQAERGNDRDSLPTSGLLFARRKIVPDEINHLLMAYGAKSQNLVKDAPLGIHERGGDRRESSHTDLSSEEGSILYQGLPESEPTPTYNHFESEAAAQAASLRDIGHLTLELKKANRDRLSLRAQETTDPLRCELLSAKSSLLSLEIGHGHSQSTGDDMPLTLKDIETIRLIVRQVIQGALAAKPGTPGHDGLGFKGLIRSTVIEDLLRGGPICSSLPKRRSSDEPDGRQRR